ncbi:uncharacterized protein [Ptychodera flava]|uniref:uncharacterized protein n=1 Tax=Ptychodera flava TaxID=63121 RepID=UPI00396A682E
MADSGQTPIETTSEQALPTSVIIVIAVGAYLVLVVLILMIRQCLLAQGFCGECAPCGKEDGSQQCCDCWVATAEACNCCAYPNMRSCLDSICGPPDQRCTLNKCMKCESCQNNQCCGNEPICDCGACDCACNCQLPECENINCLCFELKMH